MAEWGKLYGSLHGSPKWRRATKPARALWTTALSWCVDQESSDGVIPADLLRLLEGTKSEANCLVSVGLWTETEGGWRFHDWENRQRSAEQIERSREAARERKRRSRDRQAESHGVTDGVTPPVTDGVRHGVRHASRTEQNRTDKKDSCASADAERVNPTRSIDDDFADWYEQYPRKRGKGQALKAYKAARKKATGRQLYEAIRAQSPTLIAKGADFCPYPATWLNGERWNDVDDSHIPASVQQNPYANLKVVGSDD